MDPQICVKCKKSLPVSTCEGCQQSLCQEHSLEHREDLSQQKETIKKKCEQLQNDLTGHSLIQTYLDKIDQWQRDSIERIQITAEGARQKLRDILARMQTQVKVSFDPIYEDIRIHQESADYSERKFSQSMDQLSYLHQILQNSLRNDPIHEIKASIRLINVHATEHLFITEKFQTGSASIIFSEDRRTATCTTRNWDGSTVCGHHLFSTGIHSIRFEIKRLGRQNLFFGITSADQEPNPWKRQKPPYAFGWWDFPWADTDGEEIKNPKIAAGDHVSLTLDCDNRQIQLEHHRTNQVIEKSIPDEQCSLPWKIALVMYAPQDSVRIFP